MYLFHAGKTCFQIGPRLVQIIGWLLTQIGLTWFGLLVKHLKFINLNAQISLEVVTCSFGTSLSKWLILFQTKLVLRHFTQLYNVMIFQLSFFAPRILYYSCWFTRVFFMHVSISSLSDFGRIPRFLRGFLAYIMEDFLPSLQTRCTN